MSEENVNADSQTDKHDWVKEAYECFIKDAVDSDPTDPVKAIETYFQKNATDELKAAAKAEGKTAAGCWKFIEAVARKALGGRSGHIDPVAIYAIAMHWFQDVPKDWNEADKAGHSSAVTAAAVKPKPTKKAKPAPAKKPTRQAKTKIQQGFFFDILEGGDGNAH